MTAREFGFDVCPCDVAVGEEDEEVIDEVGGFGGEAFVAFFIRGDDDFDGFFADFFCDFDIAGGKEFGGVGMGGGFCLRDWMRW